MIKKLFIIILRFNFWIETFPRKGKEDYWIFHSPIVISYRNVGLDDIDGKIDEKQLHRVASLIVFHSFKTIPWLFEEAKVRKNIQLAIANCQFLTIDHDTIIFVRFNRTTLHSCSRDTLYSPATQL